MDITQIAHTAVSQKQIRCAFGHRVQTALSGRSYKRFIYLLTLIWENNEKNNSSLVWRVSRTEPHIGDYTLFYPVYYQCLLFTSSWRNCCYRNDYVLLTNKAVIYSCAIVRIAVMKIIVNVMLRYKSEHVGSGRWSLVISFSRIYCWMSVRKQSGQVPTCLCGCGVKSGHDDEFKVLEVPVCLPGSGPALSNSHTWQDKTSLSPSLPQHDLQNWHQVKGQRSVIVWPAQQQIITAELIFHLRNREVY